MKILVTGASGLLGTEICRQLKEADHEIWAVDNLSRSSTYPACDRWMVADLANPDSFQNFPTDFDQIYHYAAINGTKNFYEQPLQVLTSNFVADVNVFEFAARCEKLNKLVYASSSEVVSDDTISPTPEHTDISIKNIHNARWSYRLAKICSENFLANSSLPYVMLRYFNIYGANSKAGHFLADQIEKIKNGVFEVVGPEETRSFCYVEDAVRATIFCADNVVKEVINVGNDQEITIANAAKVIAKELGHPTENWAVLPGKAGSTTTRRPDITKLKSIMSDYTPMSFEQGVHEIVTKFLDKS